MPSKIPRFAKGGAPAGVLQPKDPNVENVGARKRTAASPLKAQPVSKKAAPHADPTSLPVLEAVVQQPTAVYSATTAAAAPPPVQVAEWDEVVSATGWTVTECLEHKLSFPKRVDAKNKVDTLVQHLKRLRAAGWYLCAQTQSFESQTAVLRDALAQEQTDRAAEAQSQRETLEKAESKAADLETKLYASKKSVEEYTVKCEELQKELKATLQNMTAAEATIVSLETDLDKQREAHVEALDKLKNAEAATSEAQKYSSQLQQFNMQVQTDLASANEALHRLQEEKLALAEEAAALRGKTAALGEALSALQSTVAACEASRTAAVEESSRMRAELAVVQEERAVALADARALRVQVDDLKHDLDRYRTATGKDLAALEQEKASAALLKSRTAAQAEINSNLQEQVVLLREERTLAQAQAESRASDVRKLSARVAELEASLSEAERRLQEGETVRRKLHNTILELKGNIRVFCRVRPAITDAEKQQKQDIIALPSTGELVGRSLQVINNPSSTEGSSSMATNKKGDGASTFTFDKVFGPDSQQSEVFEEVSQLVQSALDGYRVCIFAYGQTGSGKTHTMLGSVADEGVIPRATRQVFEGAEGLAAQGWKYEMKAAMIEIYNEKYRDLIGPGAPDGKNMTVSHDDVSGSTVVSYLQWNPVDSAASINALLKRAMSQRAVGSTAMNEQSSRSHMVFMLSIEGSNAATGQSVRGVLNLVDLAGSERLSKSGVTGGRLKETQHINKSLSALGDVIAALGGREQHVPYRNSKLTFLLQQSLSGAGKALMLMNVSPSAESVQETLCTLRFGAKANSTELGTARRNIGAAPVGGGNNAGKTSS